MRIKAKDCGFEGYDGVADVECNVHVLLRVVNAKGEPVTGRVTTPLSDSEIQKIHDIILGGMRKEEIGNLLVNMKVNSKK